MQISREQRLQLDAMLKLYGFMLFKRTGRWQWHWQPVYTGSKRGFLGSLSPSNWRVTVVVRSRGCLITGGVGVDSSYQPKSNRLTADTLEEALEAVSIIRYESERLYEQAISAAEKRT